MPRGTSSVSHGCENENKSSRLSYSGSGQQQRESQSAASNYSTNTLPKNQHQQPQQIYGSKVTNSSRSVLSDVVNKVPSVIMLPLPQQQQQQQHSQSGGNQMKGGMLKSSSSKDNLCDGSNNNNNNSTNTNTNNNEGGMNVGGGACHSQNSTLKRSKSKKEAIVNVNEKVISSKSFSSSTASYHGGCSTPKSKCVEKPLPILTTTTNCTNPKEHFLPSEMSLDDDYLSECENCKTAGSGSRYYLDDEELDEPLQETMTLQRKLMNESDENDQQNYYRVSSTLPTNTNKKTP